MSSSDLRELEREVDEARTKVLQDIVALRSPGVVAELKRDVTEQITRTKDEWIGSAKEAATDEVNSVIADVKGRALANPLAVLAIGAGIGWKLKNHPPVMSALVGLGIYGLMRADPSRPAKSVTWTRDTSRAIGETAHDWRDSDSADELSAYAEEARFQAERYRRQAEELAEEAGERFQEARRAASEKAAEWGAEAKEAAERAASYGRRLTREAGDAAYRAQAYGRRRAYEARAAGEHYYREFRDSEDRDKYLLGAAALAIAAAVGIAASRRSGD